MADARSIATPAGGNPAADQNQHERNPWAVLAVLSAAVFMLLLDTTIVNVAQVKIRQDLGASLTQIQWVLDSYILTYAVLLLSFGRLGDVFGRRRMFVVGMSIFTAASALCGASAWIGDQIGVSGVNVLIVARVLQGLGGAFMMPQSLSLITVAFPPEKRGAALGIWGGIVALGAIIGPVIGGLIVTDYAWEWIFLLNVPIGIAGVWATQRIVPESVDPLASRKIDWGGIVFSGTGIFALVYASIEGNKEGWTSPLILGLFAAAAVLLTLFVLWERRSPDPMMKLELFKLRNFWVGNVIALAVAFGMLGIFFPMTLFLQSVLDFSPIRAGLTMTPMSIMIMFAAPLSGRLSDRIGARWILVTGLTLMTVGILLIIQQIDMQTDWLALLPALIVTGAGMGMTFAPMTAASMKEVPPRIAGSASGIINTMRNVGQVLGIAVLGGVLQSRVGTHAGDRLAGDGLDPALQGRVVELAEQSRFEEIVAILGPDQIDRVLGQLRLAFADGIQNTFFVGAMACLLSALFALMIRNPARAAVPAREHAEQSERQVVMAAD
ncbi:MAG: DHA2 family efflux MFS transporter permease subunit [Thermomicrobiales bacterium]